MKARLHPPPTMQKAIDAYMSFETPENMDISESQMTFEGLA